MPIAVDKKKLLRQLRGYYFITDASLSRHGIVRDARDALAEGVRFLQYRNKEAETAVLYREALALRRLCTEAVLLINDRVDIALAVGADGVHLGQDDMPLKAARRILGAGRIIGVSVHTLAQARRAVSDGADYLGVGPLFATATKKDAGAPRGLSVLKLIRSRVAVPLVAIGGVTLENAAAVFGAGADAVCAISAVARSACARRGIRKLHALRRQ